MDARNAVELDMFVRQYVKTALWSTLDDYAQPLDEGYDYDDIEPETLAGMARTCREFVESNAADLAGIDAEQAGHDFWLTRNHHGAGFWDRGLGEVGDRLTASTHVFGEYNLYISDDGMIYGS